MATAWVYGPFNYGEHWGQWYYLDGTPHYIIKNAVALGSAGGWSYPMDVGQLNVWKEVHCQTSTDIKRIVVTHYDGVCGSDPAYEVARYGVVCELYAAGNIRVGAMLYGHLLRTSRLPPGSYAAHWGLPPTDPSRPPWWSPDGGWIVGHPAPECDCWPCAKGVHTHLQAKGADGFLYYADYAVIERSDRIWWFYY